MIITHLSFDICLFELKLWFAIWSARALTRMFTIATYQLSFLSVISFTMECISAGLHVAQSAPHKVEEFAGAALSVVLQTPVVAAGYRAGQEKWPESYAAGVSPLSGSRRSQPWQCLLHVNESGLRCATDFKQDEKVSVKGELHRDDGGIECAAGRGGRDERRSLSAPAEISIIRGMILLFFPVLVKHTGRRSISYFFLNASMLR